MNEKKFLAEFIETLGIEREVTLDTYLENISEWDSLGYALFEAFLASNYKITVAEKDIKNAKTVSDLYKTVSND